MGLGVYTLVAALLGVSAAVSNVSSYKDCAELRTLAMLMSVL